MCIMSRRSRSSTPVSAANFDCDQLNSVIQATVQRAMQSRETFHATMVLVKTQNFATHLCFDHFARFYEN